MPKYEETFLNVLEIPVSSHFSSSLKTPCCEVLWKILKQTTNHDKGGLCEASYYGVTRIYDAAIMQHHFTKPKLAGL